MKYGQMAAAVVASLLCAAAAAQLAEYGIEGMGVVSTRDNEVRASVSPDGQRIVWGSADRSGGAGGWDLWQARLIDKRWAEPAPLPSNSTADDAEPMFSADGRWLYFSSNRAGGAGGHDLYRVRIQADGGYGSVESLGPGVNSRGNERSPTVSADGRWLLFASDGRKHAGGYDLFLARWNGEAFADPRPVPGVNTAADEIDGAWLDEGRALLFSRSVQAGGEATRLYAAACDGHAYVDAQPWALSFNTAEGMTRAPVLDASKPAEIVVTGSARAPRAGKLDIYRTLAPVGRGTAGCLR
ncbi:TolB family protein [Pseudoxanthomonas wuyuanensis]|uniref:WD40-like Beta Propeller Repeat n=1 Tax=Pseudoxanthomonas wuyuanensis TaxID=1073196 RepID=A0A286D8C3_9GAMM|nr:PD40 domain-containing protein [Pseudoxanthomonas wuyuanensis]KAF1717303.1 TolB-like protein [Pseudoxanthomonas wuyuanensis]SOD54905.1 WD40-like Beta Propeller Repeat [Pseudoxanthomonas wuyuanensis]